MFFNVLTAFIFPWILGIVHLYKKDKQIIHFIAPLFSVVAFVINEFGLYFDFWKISPFFDQKTLSAMPFNLGLYPILASYLIYYIKKTNKPYLILIIFSLSTTILELTFVLAGKVIYSNGWNIYWTFFSYLFPFMCMYYYFLYLKKVNLI
ncbi:CBO0543 family protein [Bacillus sp. V2I10]|uniref:CBO0543 family protein n=1 Tax=Bacillus sp. V2I10 TaxID=3042276 RepID=UPI002788E46E|nr:CBO0543 family protein [Bacillus sp. V2I10]MDQ0857542.1 hypothetical protein [Bacillus sp. V2I10]